MALKFFHSDRNSKCCVCATDPRCCYEVKMKSSTHSIICCAFLGLLMWKMKKLEDFLASEEHMSLAQCFWRQTPLCTAGPPEQRNPDSQQNSRLPSLTSSRHICATMHKPFFVKSPTNENVLCFCGIKAVEVHDIFWPRRNKYLIRSGLWFLIQNRIERFSMECCPS